MEYRYLFVLAERFGRTVDELLFGSPNHRPLRADEMVAWAGYDKIVGWEREQANKKAQQRAKSR